MSAKKVVYLIGAGATHSEFVSKGSEKSVLMSGVCERIVEKGKNDSKLNWLPPIKEDDPEALELEQLVSLLISNGSSIKKYLEAANALKELYRNDIIECLRNEGILRKPESAINLLKLHKDSKFIEVEKLIGIISLNHDNLIEIASQEVYKGINLGFLFIENGFKMNEKSPIILKLHGSFNWECCWPIKLIDLNICEDSNSNDYLWLPPTTTKEARDFPYTKLIGNAYEILMQCDILRIIGCSLNQNDWNIINLLFSTQYFKFQNESNYYEIQLIDGNADKIKEKCPYLNRIHTISELVELEQDGINIYKEYKEKDTSIENTELSNVFKYWLDKKIRYHKGRNETDYKYQE